MKKFLSITLILCATMPLMAAKKKITPPTLRIATYNITHGKKNNWPARQENVSNVIKMVHADVFGFQEVITANHQFDTIKNTLPAV